MGLFGKRRSSVKTATSRRLWTPPSGLITDPQVLQRSVPFVFDSENLAPAAADTISLLKGQPKHVSLVKNFDLAAQLLAEIGLPGLRAEVIVILDDSWSMGEMYSDGIVQKMLVRALGFALNLDKNGIPVVKYNSPNRPITITSDNYLDAPRLIGGTAGYTPMTQAFDVAMQIADTHDKLTIIINITDGAPDDQLSMKNSVIRSSGKPVFVKNLAVNPVDFLDELDELPSRFQIKTVEDEDGNVIELVKDADDNYVIIPNPKGNGIRLIDNVDSADVDPFTASDDEFLRKMIDELGTCIELQARVGILTNVPGIDRNPAFV